MEGSAFRMYRELPAPDGMALPFHDGLVCHHCSSVVGLLGRTPDQEVLVLST
jgi:hypothetical protein